MTIFKFWDFVRLILQVWLLYIYIYIANNHCSQHRSVKIIEIGTMNAISSCIGTSLTKFYVAIWQPFRLDADVVELSMNVWIPYVTIPQNQAGGTRDQVCTCTLLAAAATCNIRDSCQGVDLNSNSNPKCFIVNIITIRQESPDIRMKHQVSDREEGEREREERERWKRSKS